MKHFLDWHSRENHFFVNPRLPEADSQRLMAAVQMFMPGGLDKTSSEMISRVEFIPGGKTGDNSGRDFEGHIFLLSSGTTATSWVDLKWTALSKTAFLASAAGVNQHLNFQSSDIWLNPLPSFHVGGLSIWARSFLLGSKVVQLENWNIQKFIQTIDESRATITALVPAQIYDLVNEGFRSPESLRIVIVGAGALSPALEIKARELGWPLVPTYGMTEACSQIATGTLDSNDLKVLPHLDVQVDADQRLCFRGTSLLSGYIYLDRRLSQEVFTTMADHLTGESAGEKMSGDPESSIRNGIVNTRPIVEDPKDKDGWFHSQDRGVVENGILKILGRTADFIKIGGESVELGRLNQIFDEVRVELGVRADLAILAVPDSRLGNVIHLVSDPNLSQSQASSIIEKFNARVLAFEKIRQWRLTDQIPRTSLGKLIPLACLERLEPSP